MEGEFPIIDFVQAVAAKGHLTTVGQEVFDERLDKDQVEDVGRRAGEPTRATLRAAGVLTARSLQSARKAGGL